MGLRTKVQGKGLQMAFNVPFFPLADTLTKNAGTPSAQPGYQAKRGWHLFRWLPATVFASMGAIQPQPNATHSTHTPTPKDFGRLQDQEPMSIGGEARRRIRRN